MEQAAKPTGKNALKNTNLISKPTDSPTTGNFTLYPIRNEEVIKTIGVTKYSVLKRKMNAVKELYNAETDLQKLLQETKQNTPTKTSETGLADQKG